MHGSSLVTLAVICKGWSLIVVTVGDTLCCCCVGRTSSAAISDEGAGRFSAGTGLGAGLVTVTVGTGAGVAVYSC